MLNEYFKARGDLNVIAIATDTIKMITAAEYIHVEMAKLSGQ